jgi:hypothetical protein
MATQYSERSQLADEDDDGLLEVLSKNGIDIQGDELAQNPVQLGENAAAVTGATSLGVDSIADSNSSVSVGRDAQATGNDSSAVGAETRAPANWNTVFGYQAGSNKNGENVVIAGRKAEAEGNDTVSIGENARANGNRSATLGKASAALAENASVFGQGSTVTGANTTLIGQGVTIDAANATGVGTGITVDADGATAVGSGSTASGVDSLALGKDTSVTQDEAVGFGDRDIDLEPGRSITYRETDTTQTLADLPTVVGSSEGTRHEYTLDINGEPILIVRAESDGQGGIQNRVTKVAGSFALDGDTNQVDDVVTGNISIEDGSGTEQVGLDATATPVDIDLHNNPVQNFRLRNGTGITYQDDPTQQSLADFNVTGNSPIGTEHGYTFDAGGVPIFKILSESDGSGGTKNHEFRAIKQFNVDGNTILDDSTSTTIYDSSNAHVPESALQTLSNSALEFTDVSINGSNGLSGGTASLGGTTTVGISGSLSLDSDLQAVNGETIWDESNTHVPESALQTLSNSALTNSSISINNSSVALGGSTTINVDLDDDQERLFGTSNDISLRFDSSNDSFRIQDNINTSDIVDVDRSTGDVTISGEFTEGAAL